MAKNQEGGWSTDPFTDRAIKKTVNYGSKFLNSKLNYGINYLENYARQYDPLGVFPARWTILNEEAEEAFDFDVFFRQNIKSESKVTQMAVEQGSFVDYNIVKTPLLSNCVLVKQGFPQDLRVYVDALLALVDSTDLVSIITPEKEYLNMKLIKCEIDRTTDNGVDTIYADCSFIEIRQVTSQYTNARVARKVSRGRQQPKETSFFSGIKSGAKKYIGRL